MGVIRAVAGLWVVLVCHQLLGLCPSPAHGLIVSGADAVVAYEADFMRALADPSVSNILLVGNITLSAALWTPKAVTVTRTVTITAQFPGFRAVAIDATAASLGSITCADANCVINVRGPGLTFINGNASLDYIFATAVPQMFYMSGDSVLTMHNVTVMSPAPSGMWLANNVLWNPASAWWVGSLKYTCLSTTELLITQWLSNATNWNKAINAPGWQTLTGYISMSNVRMALSRQYVCNGFTVEQCNNMVSICQGAMSNGPLPSDSCTQPQLSAACRPLTPLAELGATATEAGQPSADSADSGSGDSESWRIGVAAGVGGGVGLLILLAGGAFFALVARRRRQREAAYLAGKSGGADAESGGALPPSSLLSSTDTLNGARIGRDAKCVVVDGAPSEGTISKASSPMWLMPPGGAGGPGSFQTPQVLMSDTLTLKGNTLQSMMHTSTHTVVIDVVSNEQGGSGTVPQLARNPLNVTLHESLGTGAFGAVYSASWNGQRVAVKIIKRHVTDMEELSAFVHLKEASLGAELRHPRLVRTFAHALVLPEGILDDKGQLVKPGMAEAHIVSSLCDRGTLRAWLQLARGNSTVLYAASNAVSANLLRFTKQTNNPSSPRTHAHAPQQPRLDTVSTPGPAHASAHIVQPPHSAAISEAIASVSADAPEVAAAAAAAPQLPQEPCSATPAPGGASQLMLLIDSQPHTHAQNSPTSETLICAAPAGPPARRGLPAEPGSGSLALYPPLACMPAWADTGQGFHKDFTCHMVAVIDILLEVADGLSYLLSKGIVHGDLKPQNCLLCTDTNTLRGFSIQICDFGISRMLESKSHTTVTTPPGTLAYFAPELLSTCHLSPACDLYSFGIMMYELVTCRQPLGSLTMAQILYKKATGKVDEHLKFPAETPEAYVTLAQECWHVDAASRPSLPDVHARLMRVRGQLTNTHWMQPHPAPPPPPMYPSDTITPCASAATSEASHWGGTSA